ncbi:MAG: hypothetical protein ABIP53_10080, partial [Candidatus Limnocylindrales bacterium]
MTADPYAILALAEAEQLDALKGLGGEVSSAVETLIVADRSAALRLVGALSTYWQDVGEVEAGRALTERALEGSAEAAVRKPEFAQAVPRALVAASELAFRQGDQKAARKRAHDAIRAAVLIEDYVTAS